VILSKDAPNLKLLSEDDRKLSLHFMLLTRPPGDLWLFGYGSLIWNPAIRTTERRAASIEGWHRKFCHSISAGRGSPDVPGLVLGLEKGGTCTGTALKIDESDIATELPLLWRREMAYDAYIPRWIDVTDTSGRRFGRAIAFTINPASAHYAGNLSEDAIVQTLATASGGLGSSAEYLFKTLDSLRSHGIPDGALEMLAHRVESVQTSRCKPRAAEVSY